MKHTTNYNLNKIELTDSPPDITALNPNFDTIDTQLKSLVDKDAEIVASINTVKNDYLPKTGGNVTNGLTVKNKTVAVSVNGSVADANGNITIDVGGKVQSVNGVTPDANGNVAIEFGGGDVQSVDGVEPDAEGNVALNASTREEIIEGAMRVTDVQVDASVAQVEALQTAVAQVEANLDSKLPLSGGTLTGSITLKGGKNSLVAPSDDTFVEIEGGTAYGNGAKLTLYGINQSEYPAGFRITVTDGTTNTHLQGTQNGALKWANKEVERVNTINTKYIRYENGIQIVWGNVTVPENVTTTTLTLPVAFSGTNYCICFTHMSTVAQITWAGANKTTTTVQVTRKQSSSGSVAFASSADYVAIGRWK